MSTISTLLHTVSNSLYSHPSWCVCMFTTLACAWVCKWLWLGGRQGWAWWVVVYTMWKVRMWTTLQFGGWPSDWDCQLGYTYNVRVTSMWEELLTHFIWGWEFLHLSKDTWFAKLWSSCECRSPLTVHFEPFVQSGAWRCIPCVSERDLHPWRQVLILELSLSKTTTPSSSELSYRTPRWSVRDLHQSGLELL